MAGDAEFQEKLKADLQIAAIVVCLSVGLGAGVVVFALLDHILLSPLPYPEPERIVHLWEAWPTEPGEIPLGMPYAHYLALMEHSESMRSIALYGMRAASAAVSERAADTEVADVSSRFFATLGAPPLAERWLVFDDGPADEMTAVVSQRLWDRFFGLKALDGQKVLINGAAYTVVGIMPSEFAFPTGATAVIRGGLCEAPGLGAAVRRARCYRTGRSGRKSLFPRNRDGPGSTSI